MQSAICSLCYSILVWLIELCVLNLDSMHRTECLELIGYILPSLVIAQHLDFATQLVLSNCFELLECRKSASLVLEWQNCPETRCIINECDPILIMMPGASWEWAMHIRVNQGKGLIGAVGISA